MTAKKYPSARPFLPSSRSLSALEEASERCQGCPLYQGASQSVFGEGPKNAQLVLVGEQPGEQEDLKGRPFVGPAGAFLDDALEQAGLIRNNLYITNAVKHFKFEVRDGRRVGLKPQASEIEACRPWLESEIEILQPELVVAMGAVAARSLFQRAVTVSELRGRFFQNERGLTVLVTYHPSAALRHPVSTERARMRDALIEDLTMAREFLEDLSGSDVHRL
jgi:uracil-DNA glycosylase